MKKLLTGFLLSCVASVSLAVPTLSMPTLSLNPSAISDANIAANSAALTSQISNIIRGSLIKSKQFKLLDVADTDDLNLVGQSSNAIVASQSAASEPVTTTKIGALNASGLVRESTKLIRPVAANNTTVNNSLTPRKSVAQYYLFGNIIYVGTHENSYPIIGTNHVSRQFVVEIIASFKLVRVRDNKIMAAFTVSGSARDVKLVSINDISVTNIHHNTGRLINKAAQDLAKNFSQNMLQQLADTMKGAKPYHVPNTGPVITDVQVYNK